MAEWLVEEGIGEHRAALVEHGEIVAARLDWPGWLGAGQVIDAELVERAAGSPRGTALFENREDILVDGLPRDASEGAILRLLVTRSAIWTKQRAKLAQARLTDQAVRPALSLTQELGARIVPNIDGWEELWFEAIDRTIAFPGGSLTVEPTAALTAIDIDGTLPPVALSLAAVPAIARAIRRFDIAGSIVIDFPTLEAKADRRKVDAALAAALVGWPHEATAMNGFGLVQLVARRQRPSVLERLDNSLEAAVRLLMRRAEGVREPGKVELSANSRVKAAMHPGWETELARRTGRPIVWRIDERLAWHASFAQAIQP